MKYVSGCLTVIFARISRRKTRAIRRICRGTRVRLTSFATDGARPWRCSARASPRTAEWIVKPKNREPSAIPGCKRLSTLSSFLLAAAKKQSGNAQAEDGQRSRLRHRRGVDVVELHVVGQAVVDVHPDDAIHQR